MSYEAEHMDIEIQTLLNSRHGVNHDNNSVSSVIQSVYHKNPDVSRLGFFCTGQNSFQRQRSSDSESSCLSSDEPELLTVKVNGADIHDLPTEYSVQGLRLNEVPVVGTYVDKRVVPGFKYKVRKLGSKNHLFGGRALRLLSVGMGYGKRITFEGDSLNINDNYFYSDTHPEGYGFSLQAISADDKFVVYDEAQRCVGSVQIERVRYQEELGTDTTDKGDIKKTVSVCFACNVRYESEPNCLSVLSSTRVELQALLVIVKANKSREARVQYIGDVNLDHVGSCTFELA